MAVTALPTPPSRSDPATFAARGDAFMSALPTFQAEINALQITTNAQTAADAAASATSAAEAVVAKNAAIAAWAASMSPAETLPALSQSLHIGAVVKAIVYDTSKDSDGGAWRKRCQDKSWYTETLGGDRWIGQHATIAAAWTAAGSTTGAVYQASATAGAQTSGLFYTPTSSTTVTQVYRGVTREFPAVAGIVAESARVVIYDLATGAMWMVFLTSYATNPRLLIGTANTSVTAGQGKLILAGGIFGITTADFLADIGSRVNATATYRYPGNIAARNTEASSAVYASTTIVNSTVIDVAITVLDTAPTDPATGLPVPTIAVATAAGTSIILDSGAVNNKTLSANPSKTVRFGQGSSIWIEFGTGTASSWNYYTDFAVSTTASNKFSNLGWSGTFNVLGLTGGNGVVDKSGALSFGHTLGLEVSKGYGAFNAAGNMHAAITTAYNTGWLPGDIRGAYLADTTAETVTASGELVTNGTFTTDTTGWDASGATLSVVSGKMRVTTTGQDGRGRQVVNTVVGKTYRVSVDASAGTATLGIAVTAGSSFALNAVLASTPASTTATLVTDFVATATTTSILVFALGAAVQTGDFDNISVKLAEPDRSVKNKGLVINGSLSKTAVASGAGLVAWSGFSAANYLEQPYNSDLDFGTGDFCVMGWVNATVTARLYARGIVAGALAMAIDVVPSTGTVNIYKSSGFWLASSASAFTSGQTFLLCVSRTSGTVTISVNGVVVATATSDTTNLTLTNAVMRFGVALDGTTPLTSGSTALWRISATAPSADQIAHIYRTELPLFQASAQCTIAGSSTAVTALAYDDTSELLHVGTSWGRTGFKDLLRVDSEATTTGALTSLSASQGVIITGGTSGKVYVPAFLLRDELRRKDEARKALGKAPVFFDHTATASQTAFVAPKGYTIKAVYHNGTLKRETTTGVYWTRSSDGFAETCTLSAGATVSDWISLMCVRT